MSQQYSNENDPDSGSNYHQHNDIVEFAGSSNNNYVDLNQFLKQHFSNPSFNQQQLMMPNFHGANYPNHASTSSGHNNSNNLPLYISNSGQSADMISSSNLLPTAAEFIPRFNNLNITDDHHHHHHHHHHQHQQQNNYYNHPPQQQQSFNNSSQLNYMQNNEFVPMQHYQNHHQQPHELSGGGNSSSIVQPATSGTTTPALGNKFQNHILSDIPNTIHNYEEQHRHHRSTFDDDEVSTNHKEHNQQRSNTFNYKFRGGSTSSGIGSNSSNANTNVRRNQNNRNSGDVGDDTTPASSSSYRNQQKQDNNRHNKRRDNWNRNRDRELLSDPCNSKYFNGLNLNERRIDNNNALVENSLNNYQQQQYLRDSPKKYLHSVNKSPHKSNLNATHNHQQQLQQQQLQHQLEQQLENEKLPQREKLIKEIECRKLECPVCVETIKAHQSVWSCHSCYHIFHLNCIVKWATSSKSENGWRCPACQNISKQIPHHYYCFCGKIRNPERNRLDLAHSCGETCGRKDNCLHPCTLLCHPGPCPACQALVTRECGCGKTVKTMQCYIKPDIECDLICGKLLNCELHVCEQKCHQGKCPPCEHKIDQTCHCGKQERQVLCTRDSNDKKTYSCGKACNKSLSCNNHKCKDCCHAGDCKPCKLGAEVITACPCGALQLVTGQRKTCLDPIPVCSGMCGKTLKCGPPAFPHHCLNKCHIGNCPPCNKQTAVKCRCGHMDQMIKCRQLSTRADDARCKKRCTKKRSCGKHKCNQECCIDIDHICPMPCNYTLSCGKHKCDQPCHRGNCQPCYRSSFEELYCECGANVIYPPVPCGTKRPACEHPCSRSHACNHPVQHNCHSGVNCPPCIILTTKWCFGQHEQRKTIPCNQESFSCGLPCNKDLICGRHKCIKPCHENSCQVTGEICKQSCVIPRNNCSHKCNASCHDGDCPDTPCKEMVEVTCECGNRKQMRTCHDFSRDYRRIATAALASSMADMQRGSNVELSDIMGPPKMTSNKTLECTEECRVLERNRRLAIGLQIRNPDISQKLLTRYSEFIRGWAKKDPHLVKTIHNALTDLVKLAKESKQKSRSHSFPTMNREKRQLVHEMCGMFGVESEAYDAEPNRNVVATASKGRAWLPAMSIMEVIQRESGQRRVPVPNNAWGIKK